MDDGRYGSSTNPLITLNFLDLPPKDSEYKTSRYVVVPVPYEKSTSYEKGTVKGPLAIINASAQVEFYDEEVGASACFEKGISTIAPIARKGLGTDKAILSLIQKSTERITSDGKIPILLGGEHTISYASISAFYKKYRDLQVIYVDAHADLRDSYEGNMFSHACVMRRVVELGIPIHGVGIRALSEEEAVFIKKRRINIIYDYQRRKDWIDKFLKKIPEWAPVYLSIDADGLDPAIMPSVGTPVPGGLSWEEILTFSRRIIERFDLIGFDFVELSPREGVIASDFLAAKLIYKIISYNEVKGVKTGNVA